MLRQTLRYLWAAPNTLIGCAAGSLALATGGRVRCVEGTLEFYGGGAAFLLRRCVPIRGGAMALTLGHVVLGRDAEVLDRCRCHEAVHVRQYERWGPVFIPAYLTASMLAWLRGGDPYRDNPFERAAFDVEVPYLPTVRS